MLALSCAETALEARPVASGVSDNLGPARIIKSYTAEDNRRGLENIALSEHGIRRCMRKYLITGYTPGQAAHNLAEYPRRARQMASRLDRFR